MEEINLKSNNDLVLHDFVNDWILEPIVDSNDRQTGTGSDGGVVAVGFFESPNARQIELDSKEDDETYKSLKQKWKSENPDQNIKFWKDQYIKSKIDKLPWETND